MNLKFPFKVELSFPGDLEYIPSVRKFVSEVLLASNFSPKFAYRSEIIVDEICNNAVNYGCRTTDARIDLECEVFDDKIEFVIKDQGGTQENLERLQSVLKSEMQDDTPKDGLGLEIVKMLSEGMNVVIDDNNLTSVHITRKREDMVQGS
jgi:anti-sigma regulatory factor (Ser/Thr protein kinase)